MEDEDVSDVDELLDEMESTLSSNLVTKQKLIKPESKTPIKHK